MFEIPKCIAVEQNKNCDHFGITHPPFSLAMFWTIGRGIWERKRGFVHFWIIFFAEIICNTIDFCNFADKFHEDCSFVIWLIINSKYTKNNPLFRFLLKLFWGKRRTAYPELGLYDCIYSFIPFGEFLEKKGQDVCKRFHSNKWEFILFFCLSYSIIVSLHRFHGI